MIKNQKIGKGLFILTLSVALCFSTVSCGNNATQETNAIDSKHMLHIQIENEVATLDPQMATDGCSFEVIANFMDGLYQADSDGNAVPALAESEIISEDGLTYTIKIREDANWSNGDPVTAHDFVFAWRRAVDPDVAAEFSFIFSDVAMVKNAADICAGKKDVSELGITAIDDKTLQIELEVPVVFFNSLLHFPTFYPINQAFFESCGDTFGTSADTVLSNGAFKLSEYEPVATSFAFVKNESYYDADKINLIGLKYFVIKENQQVLLNYQNGQLDVCKLSGSQVEQVKNDAEFHGNLGGYLWYISPNIKKVPALSNINMRKAISCAIDRDALINYVLKDGSIAAEYVVTYGTSVDENGKDFRDTAKKYNLSDKEKAVEYYKTACEELGQNSFTFEMVVDDDEMTQNVAAFLQEEIQATLPSITISLKVEPKKQRIKDVRAGNYEISFLRGGPYYADPTVFLTMWYTDNNNNFGQWSNKEYDQILDDCMKGKLANDSNARWEALHHAEEMIMDNLVIIPVYQKADAVMLKSNVSGVEFHSIGVNRVYKNTVKK